MDPIEAAHRLIKQRRNAESSIEVVELLMKRNLVFVSITVDGDTGTWVWCFDQDGNLLDDTRLA